MTISPEVQQQFFVASPDGATSHVIRLLPVAVASPQRPSRRVGKPWTTDEHDRFLEGLQLHPSGPWRLVASHVGTRTTLQTMTHAQKYRERISRLLVPLHCLHAPSPPWQASFPLPLSHPSLVAFPVPMPPTQHSPLLETTTTESRAPVPFDEVDLEMLSRLLWDDSADDSGRSSSSSCGSREDVVEGELVRIDFNNDEVDDDSDQDMLHLVL